MLQVWLHIALALALALALFLAIQRAEPSNITSVPKSHIQISTVWYSPMIRRYLSHTWAPRSAVLAHDTKISVYYMGAPKLHWRSSRGEKPKPKRSKQPKQPNQIEF